MLASTVQFSSYGRVRSRSPVPVRLSGWFTVGWSAARCDIVAQALRLGIARSLRTQQRAKRPVSLSSSFLTTSELEVCTSRRTVTRDAN